MSHIVLQGISVGNGLVESLGEVMVIAGTIVLLLMLIAFGAFVYQSVTGDGMTDPREATTDRSSEDGVRRGQSDEEWEYY